MTNNIELALHNLRDAGENLRIFLPSSLAGRKQTFILYEFSLSMFSRRKSENISWLKPLNNSTLKTL